ncbi:MAG: tyrosine--tRNA ligase [bacterium]
MSLSRLKRGFEEILPEDEFDERMQDSCRIKLGVDPTGSELHLGHAVIFNKLRQFQDAGHTVVFLVGDFTAQIGDPSGRDETRPPLSAEEVEEHAETYTDQAFEILDEDRAEVVWNSEWLNDLGTEGIMDLASRMTVARMLERDDFSKRYEQNKSIRLHEFLYPLLQGYDSVEIEADLELGGTDQKFNLLVGRRLQKEMTDQPPQLIGTLPLLVGLDGSKKMSKSYDNHIPLEASPRDMFGKLMSIPDHLVPNYAKLLTDLPEDYLSELEAGGDNLEDPKKHKKKVASAIVERLKGNTEAEDARDYFERTIEEDQAPGEDEMETVVIDDGDDVWVVDLLDQSGMVESRGEAKRLLNQGGVYFDGEQLEGLDHDFDITEAHVLQVGQHRYRRLVPGD